MKLIASRFIAILMLVVPGIVACFGILKMKNTLFLFYSDFGNDSVIPQFQWLNFLFGFVMFGIGVGFIGGWIFFRDRKRNYVAPRFKEKRLRPPKPQA